MTGTDRDPGSARPVFLLGSQRCGTTALFEGKVGRRKNHVAVRIEREFQRPPVAER